MSTNTHVNDLKINKLKEAQFDAAVLSGVIDGTQLSIITDAGLSYNELDDLPAPVQVSTIPTAASTNEGQIVQFIGTTTASYTNGYFYKCVSDGAVSPTYAWQQIDVQPSQTVDQTYNSSSTNAQSGTAVAGAISSAISSVYKAAGSVTFANLPSLSSAIEGYVYDISDAFTTTSDFVEGAGNSYPAGTNVVCINTAASGQTAVYKWDVLSALADLSGYLPLTGGTVDGLTTFTETSTGSYNLVPVLKLGAKLSGGTASNLASISMAPNSGTLHMGSIVATSVSSNSRGSLGASVLPWGKIFVDEIRRYNSGSEYTVSIPLVSGTMAVQVSSMPTADATYESKIYQYIGTTDATYTNGYFYKCVSDGQSPATYSWENIEIQPSADPLPSQTGQNGKFLTTNGTSASWETVSTTLSGLTDTTITNPTSGQVLSYNGSVWINSEPTPAMVIVDYTAV